MVEYTEDKELTELIDKAVREFGDLKAIRANNVTVMGLMKVDMAESGEAKPCKGFGVTVKKISDAERFLMKKSASYLVIVDYGKWNELNRKQREALVHHGLCFIKVEKSDSGKIKLGKDVPDIVVFTKNIERYGPWFDSILNLRELLRGSAKAVMSVLPEAVETNDDDDKPEVKAAAAPAPAPAPAPPADDEVEAEEKPLSPPPRKKVNKQ